MFELVQITAQYSNAVLVAVLPYVTDFSQKLDLPISTPVTADQVLHFKCDSRKDHVGGFITLTNGFQFTFLDGRVCVYRSPQSYFSLQKPELIPNFYGPLRVNEGEALNIAHEAIQKLGYSNDVFHTNKPPKITPPERIGTNHVARYLFQWLDPDWTRSKNIVPVLLDIEVNASNRQIEMITFGGRETQRPAPRVDVEPPPQNSKLSESHANDGRKLPSASPAYSSVFLKAILPQIDEFVAQAGLSVPTPITTNDVDVSQYSCLIDRGDPSVQIYLKNGDRFNYRHGRVMAFYAHDVFYQLHKIGQVDDFLGKKNMSTNDAIALAKKIVRSLGYKGKKMDVGIGAPVYIGNDRFTRYFVHFHRPEDNSYIAAFEIDLEGKAVKSIFLDDPSLRRKPPQVDVPMVETNAGSGDPSTASTSSTAGSRGNPK
jgi:hypothetical protein